MERSCKNYIPRANNRFFFNPRRSSGSNVYNQKIARIIIVKTILWSARFTRTNAREREREREREWKGVREDDGCWLLAWWRAKRRANPGGREKKAIEAWDFPDREINHEFSVQRSDAIGCKVHLVSGIQKEDVHHRPKVPLLEEEGGVGQLLHYLFQNWEN